MSLRVLNCRIYLKPHLFTTLGVLAELAAACHRAGGGLSWFLALAAPVVLAANALVFWATSEVDPDRDVYHHCPENYIFTVSAGLMSLSLYLDETQWPLTFVTLALIPGVWILTFWHRPYSRRAAPLQPGGEGERDRCGAESIAN